MAQVVAGGVGAVIGFVASGYNPAGAQWGYAIGSALYAVSQPGPHSEGPRLNDLKATGTDWGQPIPWVAGHPRISGQIVYASQKRQIATTTEQEGGKGSGPTYTSYTYEVDLLILLTDNEIETFSRIWDNGKLIYSVLNGSSTETLTASASSDKWTRMTVYGGASDQLPDPTYEAAVGIGRAPAYRGRGSIFIEGLKLGTSGQLPNLTFEIVKFGDVASGEETMDWDLDRGSGISPPVFYNVAAFAEGGYQYHVVRTGTAYTVDVYWVDKGAGPLAQTSYVVPTMSNQQPMPYGIGDVSGVCFANVLSGLVQECSGGAGTAIYYNGVGGTANTAFSRRGEYTYFAVYSSGNVTIKKYASGVTGSEIDSVTHAISGDKPGIDTDGTFVYVIDQDDLHLFGAGDLSYFSTIALPFTHSGYNWVSADSSGVYVMEPGATAHLYKLNGAAWEEVASWTKNDSSSEGAGQSPWRVISGNWYRSVFHGSSGVSWTQEVWSVTSPTVSPEDETLESVVEQLMLRAGYDASEFDATALSAITKPVRALSIASIGATRATMELLMQSYYFDCVLSDKLYFRPRQTTPVATIEWDELGASNSPEGDPDPLKIKYRNELEVPAQMAVSYINVANDYQTGTEFSDRALSEQSSTTGVQIGLGMTPAEAKGIADALVLDNFASIAGTTIKIPFTRPEIEAADVVTVNGDVESYRMRLIRKNDSGGILEFEAVVDDANALLSAQITDDDYTPQTEVQGIADTLWSTLDIALLRDSDNSPGWYVAAKKGSGGSLWPGAGILNSWDGVSYAQVASFTSQSVFGVTETALDDWEGGNVFDEASRFTVNVGGGELSSSTRSAMLADLTINVLLIGNEIVRFRTATMTAPGVYVLSGFIRGFRGTQWAMTGHATPERVVLLNTNGLRRVATEAAQIDVPRYVEGVTFNKPMSSATPETFTDTGIVLKPFAPRDLRVARDASGNITTTWRRMTRLSFRLLSEGIDPPIGEALELYDAEIYDDNTYTTVVRTFSALTAPEFDYSDTEQTTDFGSPQATIYVHVYQRSAIVGRGYPLEGEG